MVPNMDGLLGPKTQWKLELKNLSNTVSAINIAMAHFLNPQTKLEMLD